MQVRIKVLVSAEGDYCGYGYNKAKSNELDDTLYEVVFGHPTKEYWLTADLPLPQQTEVEAVVETTESDIGRLCSCMVDHRCKPI